MLGVATVFLSMRSMLFRIAAALGVLSCSANDVHNFYFASAVVVDVSLVDGGEIDEVTIHGSAFSIRLTRSLTRILPVPHE